MGFTMRQPNAQNQLHEAARQAIDEDALAEVLELAAGEECEHDSAVALREVLADEIVADALAATQHARRRGRLPTADDVGDAADERRKCCLPPMRPTHAQIESS